MHRIDSYGATADNRFTDGDPVVPTPPTVVKDDWLNSVQEEIAHAVEAAGIVLDKEDNQQLWKAILSRFFGRKINTTAPLTGGGDLGADRTLGLAGFAVQAGMPVMTASAKLEHNCAWPDGSLVLFADWPDLQARYEGGYIDALALGSAPAAIAAYPGRFVAHANGLYLPSLGGLFPRPWTPAQTQDAGRSIGSLQGDAMRKQAGIVGVGMDSSAGLTTCTPPFASDGDSSGRTTYTAGGTYKGYVIRYDNALGGNPTATENRPQNYAQPMQIYLGRHKSEV